MFAWFTFIWNRPDDQFMGIGIGRILFGLTSAVFFVLAIWYGL
jgi:hypothetical protein